MVQNETERIPSASFAVYIMKFVKALQTALTAMPANSSFMVFPPELPLKAIINTKSEVRKAPPKAPTATP